MSDSELRRLCLEAFDRQTDWRSGDRDDRRAAFQTFQDLLHRIAEGTHRSYVDVLDEAVEDWVHAKFCSVDLRGDSTPVCT